MSILYHFRVKVHYFNLPHLHLAPQLGVTPFDFAEIFGVRKLRVSWLSCGVISVILRLAVLTIPACDEQTDASIYSASIASRGKNGLNIASAEANITRQNVGIDACSTHGTPKFSGEQVSN